MQRAARIFFCYCRADESLRDELAIHLAPLRSAKLIEDWYDRNIDAGVEWNPEIQRALERANIILLLVSPSFMASNYIQDVELKRAMERHHEKSARIIPVIARPTELKYAEFKALQYLPRDGKPVTRWPDRDEAWLDVAHGIRKVVETLLQSSNRKPSPPPSDAPRSVKVTAASPRATTVPTIASLRQLIEQVFKLDSDLEAFCHDHFPEAFRRFTGGMDRTHKVTLLLQLAERQKIVEALRCTLREFSIVEGTLKYE